MLRFLPIIGVLLGVGEVLMRSMRVRRSEVGPMVDQASETRQTLLDQAAAGQVGSRELLSAMSVDGSAGGSSSEVGQALSAGETQRANRASLRPSFSFGHAAGTCRMGVDSLAVVDLELRVHGAQQLRVAGAVDPRFDLKRNVVKTLTIGRRNP